MKGRLASTHCRKRAIPSGTIIGGRLGLAYHAYIIEVTPPASGLVDLVAFFLRRAHMLLRSGGAFGLFATNTIAQGDTREASLRHHRCSGGRHSCGAKTVQVAWRRRRHPERNSRTEGRRTTRIPSGRRSGGTHLCIPSPGAGRRNTGGPCGERWPRLRRGQGLGRGLRLRGQSFWRIVVTRRHAATDR